MKILAVLDQTAFDGLADATVLGKDAYVKDEKTNNFKLAMDGEEAGKLATPLQTQLENKKTELTKVHGEKNEIAGKLKTFEDLGKSADEIKTVLETGKAAGVEELEKKHTAEITSLKTSHEQALKAANDAITAAQAEKGDVEKHLIGEIKRTTIAELKNKYGMNALGDDYLANRIDVIYDDDAKKYVTRVMENGEIAYKAGVLKTADQLAEEAKANKDLGGMFTAGAGAGSGAPTRQTPTPANGFVNSNDKAAMEASLEDIASGKVKVI